MLTFTKEQLSEVMCKHAEKENGLHDLLEIMLESLMVAERGEFLREQEDRNKGNGYRLGHTYGHGRKLEFRIPRDRFGNFHPKILAILRDQEEECEKLAGSLYTKGLTQAQVGQVFDEIYGEHYSKSSISRMIDYVRQEVSAWLVRGLDAYYPIVFVDCVHIKVFRKKKAATEDDILAAAPPDPARIRAAIAQLPDISRIILTLVLVEGLDYGEISALTGEREGTLRAQYSRARKRLAALLKQKMHEEDE